jgi:hypothetical protein
VNSVKVAAHAAEEIMNMPAAEHHEVKKEISEDWLNAFESHAVNMSSEHMQKLFGKILAGEIRRPSSFSIKTINLMAELDNDVAASFRRFRSLVMSFGPNGPYSAFVLTLGSEHLGACLHDFGLGYSQLLALAEYGLTVPGDPAQSLFALAIKGKLQTPHVPFTFENKRYELHIPEGKKPEDFSEQDLELAVTLTRAGRELLDVVDFDNNQKYSDALFPYLKRKGLLLKEVAASVN